MESTLYIVELVQYLLRESILLCDCMWHYYLVFSTMIYWKVTDWQMQ